MKWGHDFSPNTGSQLTLAVNSYNSELDNKNEIEGFIYQNGVTSTNITYHLETRISAAKRIDYGLEANYSLINPGESQNTNQTSSVLEFDIDQHKALETALYAQYSLDINDQFAVSGGLRYSQYYRFGEGTVYLFDYNLTESQFPERRDTINYGTRRN